MNSEPRQKFAASPAFTIEKRRQRDTFRPYLCAVVLLAQVAFVTYHRFSAGRLSRLTPFAGQTSYRIAGMMNDVPLRGEDVRARYGLRSRGTIAGSPEDLRRIVRRREAGKDSDDTVFLRLHTRENGGLEEIWLWPQQ